MLKCYIDALPNGYYRVVDAKYGITQGEYPDESFAFVAAMKIGYRSIG